MTTVGIIAEYNPFHKGHQYQIQKIKEQTGADFIIVVMSGDFMQRGAPALIDKYSRTAMALAGGVDIVFELPVLFATSSSENFARAGVALLNQLGNVDYLCFGSELGNLAPLKEAANLLINEPVELSSILKEAMRAGNSFPVARNKALSSFLPYEESTWTSPNNLLAIEYLKAIEYVHSSITPITIKREGSFHSDAMDTSFASASAIRKALAHAKDVTAKIPRESLPYLSNHQLDWEDFYDFLSIEILKNWTNLTDYLDISTELSNRIQNVFSKSCSMEELCQNLKTKQYTYTRIQRGLLHILLGIKKDFKTDYAPYARVLGFRKEKSSFFKEVSSSIPLVTKMTKFHHPLLDLEIKASSIYELALKNKYQCKDLKNEFTRGMIIYSQSSDN